MRELPIRCTCEWSCPETGSVHAMWPSVLDPRCAVHARKAAERGPLVVCPCGYDPSGHLCDTCYESADFFGDEEAA